MVFVIFSKTDDPLLRHASNDCIDWNWNRPAKLNLYQNYALCSVVIHRAVRATELFSEHVDYRKAKPGRFVGHYCLINARPWRSAAHLPRGEWSVSNHSLDVPPLLSIILNDCIKKCKYYPIPVPDILRFESLNALRLVQLEPEKFITFDDRQRLLATAAGLTVAPDDSLR